MPIPMTLDQALESAHPIGEIFSRIRTRPSPTALALIFLTPSEKMFYEITYFIADTNNGGLHQTFTNDTGAHFGTLRDFAHRHGAPALAALMDRIAAIFPNGEVPLDRDERSEWVWALSTETFDPFEEVTQVFHSLVEQLERDLIAYVRAHRDQFPSLDGVP